MIELKHLSKIYDNGKTKVEAIRDINLTIEDGDIFGIIGLSGAGKSTLIRCINFLEKPTEGQVIFDGVDLGTISHKELLKKRQSMSMIFQSFNLLSQRTALGNICYPLEIAGVNKNQAKEKARELLKIVGLEDKEKSYPVQLSGGQQQRTALARILAYEPRVLLLDEPFSAMDTYLREGLRLELARVLKDYDGASVMVTHDRDEAYQLCDYLLLMDNGHVLTAGRTRDIFQNPGTCQAARLTGCKNISRIERLGARQVKALDWNGLVLTTEQEVGPEIFAVGIRAHDLEPAADGIGINRIPVGNGSVTEMPFEWYVTLENGLWWKVEKTIHTHDSAGVIPQWLTVQPEAVLLLRGE